MGLGLDGVPGVGHMLGSYQEGSLVVVKPTDCRHIPASSKAVAAFLDAFITESTLPPYNRIDHTGFWREVMVRTSSVGGGAMVMVKVQKRGHVDKVVADELDRLHQAISAAPLRNADGDEVGKMVATLYVVDNDSSSGVQDTPEGTTLIFGSPVIRETMAGAQFDIAPQAFFQVSERTYQTLRACLLCACFWTTLVAMGGAVSQVLYWTRPYVDSHPRAHVHVHTHTHSHTRADPTQVNTAGASVLIDVLKRSCPSLTEKTTLLDICCGTGTIGILLAASCRRVIGVDICAEAIENARVNATLNGVTNCEHIAAKAEDAIRDVMKSCEQDSDGNVVAIVDPPRAGLHKDVVQNIRRHNDIKHLIYISCSLGGAKGNIVDFCRATSKKFRGRPFEVRRVIPVDLFPHTMHCESVVVLERTEE